MSERLNMETRMLRETQEAPQVVARLLESNAPLYRDLGERLRGDHGDVTACHGWDSPSNWITVWNPTDVALPAC
jgi:hypothetical protein